MKVGLAHPPPGMQLPSDEWRGAEDEAYMTETQGAGWGTGRSPAAGPCVRCAKPPACTSPAPSHKLTPAPAAAGWALRPWWRRAGGAAGARSRGARRRARRRASRPARAPSGRARPAPQPPRPPARRGRGRPGPGGARRTRAAARAARRPRRAARRGRRPPRAPGRPAARPGSVPGRPPGAAGQDGDFGITPTKHMRAFPGLKNTSPACRASIRATPCPRADPRLPVRFMSR